MCLLVLRCNNLEYSAIRCRTLRTPGNILDVMSIGFLYPHLLEEIDLHIALRYRLLSSADGNLKKVGKRIECYPCQSHHPTK